MAETVVSAGLHAGESEFFAHSGPLAAEGTTVFKIIRRLHQ